MRSAGGAKRVLRHQLQRKARLSVLPEDRPRILEQHGQVHRHVGEGAREPALEMAPL
jgi:hypothetical protein